MLMDMKKTDIRSLSLAETTLFMESIGEKSFRAKQVFEWINNKFVTAFDEMSNISKDLRKKLSDHAYISQISIVKKLESEDDNTIKYLFAFENDNIIENEGKKHYIESVLMRYRHGNTVCVSSQVGCRMGCGFCASTIGGLERNLTSGEMAAQIYEIARDVNERISNVVIMGSGEPLDNYDHVLKFIHLINEEKGVNIGQRHITLSTCGIIPKIYELMEEHLQITLAVSLHAPNDDIRKKTMPVAQTFPMDKLLKACKEYSDALRRITFEYAMIDGLNDSTENALELAKKLKNMLCHVNLIPVNEVKERDYKKSGGDTIERFAQTLKEHNIETTIRRKLGSDINAACGQLRKDYM